MSKDLVSTNQNSKLALSKAKNLINITNKLLTKQEPKNELSKNNSLNNIIQDKYGNIYKEVVSSYTQRVWLDRNLGASRVATAIDDEESYGDYFQWGRDADGHEKKDSKTTNILCDSDTPNHDKFINGWDWEKEQDNTLWQGINGKNNPCPKGYRIPTIEELEAETIEQGVENNVDMYNSFLKVPSSGDRRRDSGSLEYQGSNGGLWSSSVDDEYSLGLYFNPGVARKSYHPRASVFSVRCIKDELIPKDIAIKASTDIVSNQKVWIDPDTSLVWQVKIEDKEYTWEESFKYAKRLNSENYGGYNDWRVPSIDELKTILTEEPHKNSNSFTKITYIKKPLLKSMTMEYQWFRSSATYSSYYTSLTWEICFNYGNAETTNKYISRYVRCVRGKQ